MQRLQQFWKGFAGPSACLAFRVESQGKDASLAARLQKWTDILAVAENQPFPLFWSRLLTSKKPSMTLRNADVSMPQITDDVRWAESRRALLDVLDSLAHEKEATPYDYLASLSHTRGFCVAVSALAGEAKARGIGVDIEFSQRLITQKAQNRFLREDEKAFGFKPLHVWMIKEACFKADPENKDRLVTQYHIVGDHLAQLNTDSENRFRFAVFEEDQLSFAFALSIK